ncbi:hypothetical protein MNBD_GAMMA16-1779 [hydrothermal vent metagenome]|uniref:Uncharacterized protein n=1 Tax=hydrothermal vent metagenome TaxID=652676 RepID=A0A3B0ZCH8_9ZZZZ
MAYLFWAVAAAILLLILMKYRAAKTRHQAAGNVVFAKYTFGKLSLEDQTRVKEKAEEIANKAASDEIEEYGWYAVAMHALKIPSAIPDNASWYHTKRPDVLRPSDLMVRSVLIFLNNNYNLNIEISGLSSPKKEKPPIDSVLNDEEEPKKLSKPDIEK